MVFANKNEVPNSRPKDKGTFNHVFTASSQNCCFVESSTLLESQVVIRVEKKKRVE